MTWPDQVVHVVRKDLARARWLILGWTALVALLTLWIVAPEAPGAIPVVPGALLLFVLGTGFAAWLIQQDGPHREGTFWPGLPLSPGAVLAGKVVVAFGVGVGIPLVGQLLTLLAFPMPAADLPWLLARSSVSMGAGITLGLVLGSVTGSLRMAAGLLVGSFIAVAILQGAMSYVFLQAEVAGDFPPPAIRGWGLVFGPLGAMSCAAFLLILYRRGRVGRLAQGLGVLLGYGCVLAALGGIGGVRAWEADTPASGTRDFAVAEDQASRVEVLGLRLPDPESMPALSSSAHRMVALDVMAHETRETGTESEVRTWLEPASFRLVNAQGVAEVTRPARLRDDWFQPVESEAQPGVHPSISLPMNRPDVEALLAGNLQVEVHGFLVTRELRRLPPIDLVPGGSHASPGLRVTVLAPSGFRSPSEEESGLSIRLERLTDPEDPSPLGRGPEARVPLADLVEIRAPAHEPPRRQRGRTAWGGGRASFLLAGIPRLDVTMEPRPPLPVGGSGTVSIGIWEHVRSEAVVFRVPAELVTLSTPGPRGPS